MDIATQALQQLGRTKPKKIRRLGAGQKKLQEKLPQIREEIYKGMSSVRITNKFDLPITTFKRNIPKLLTRAELDQLRYNGKLALSNNRKH